MKKFNHEEYRANLERDQQLWYKKQRELMSYILPKNKPSMVFIIKSWLYKKGILKHRIIITGVPNDLEFSLYDLNEHLSSGGYLKIILNGDGCVFEATKIPKQ